MKKKSFIQCIYGGACFLLTLAVIDGCSTESVREPFDPNNHGPIIVKNIRAEYPAKAAKKGIEGEVWVKVRIDSLGKVRTVMVDKSPDPLLSGAAMDAAVKIKFKPAMMDGRPIGVWFSMPISVKKK